MRCDFCGEEIEGQPFHKDGMCFCSVECCDAMEGGEAIPLGDEILDDPDADDEYDDSYDDDSEESNDDEKILKDYGIDEELFGEDE